MGDLGFWALAQEDPDYLALVTPDGAEVRAGELLGHANQLVHALRAQGLAPGDVVATVLPNCAEMIEVYLAALQAGWYLVPINHHLVGSRDRLHPEGLRGQGVRRPRALRRRLRSRPPTRPASPQRRFAVGPSRVSRRTTGPATRSRPRCPRTGRWATS